MMRLPFRLSKVFAKRRTPRVVDPEREAAREPVDIAGSDAPCDEGHAQDQSAQKPSDEPFDPTLRGPDGMFGHVDWVGPHSMTGWVQRPAPFDPPVTLQLWEAGKCIATVKANRWRQEFADLRQGNGSIGFDIAYPKMLYGGGPRDLELRDADSGACLTSAKIGVDLPLSTLPRDKEPPQGPPEGTPIELSIIVNFYNMQREAERTLTSLSRSYQRDIGDLAYEVICVDNGSNPPMDADWVAGFGPEFRLFRPANPHPSPVFALNEAAAQARGKNLAMMIDGAHVLSPGVLSEAMAGLRSEPGAIVAVRLWFVGGDQRWLSQVGYTREHEDILFARIDWPVDGYRLFFISTPIFETPTHWLEGLSETNCLFIARQAFEELGGYDEAFSMPGAGLGNLDLFTRAVRAPGSTAIALIGEASFHQYHGGTTTNVSDARKDDLVRSYLVHYESVRGHPFTHIEAHDMKLRGKLPGYEREIFGRQRPAIATYLGLSDQLRPASLWLHLDKGAQEYVQSVYAEAGMRHRTIWAGQSTGIAPPDLIEIQQMLWEARPEVLILKNVAPGLVNFICSIQSTLGLEALRIICICENADIALPAGVDKLVGDPMDEGVLAKVEDIMAAAERACVIFQPLAHDTLPVEALQLYARFVTPAGYLVVLDTGLGQPEIGYSKFFLKRAIQRFLESDKRFVIDTTKNAHLVTTCASGFLYRVSDNRFGLAEASDELEEF